MSIYEKLAKIQTSLKAPKNLYNKFGGYAYRNAEGIQEAVKPFLEVVKCSLTLTDEVVLIGERFYIKATATLTDSETGESLNISAFAREAETKKGMDEAQITGATSSYARKYALNGLFLLDDNKDADTEEYHNAQNSPSNASKQSGNKTTPKASAKPAQAPQSANDDTARAELRHYIAENKLNPAAIAQACGLNANSTSDDFQKALEYAKQCNEVHANDTPGQS